MEDVINHPKHYADTCSLECIEAMRIAFGRKAVISFCECNAFKYLWRYKNKNGEEDLKKSKWYCEYGLKLLFDVTCDDKRVKAFTNMMELLEEKGEKKK